ncbi:MAG: hypothetical protein AB2A00_02535 [Myxococcota bacterium]
MTRNAALGLVTACLLSCSQPPTPPFIPPDDDTGLVGVSVPEGSLAGTWGVVIEWATVVTVPILGDRNGGSQGSRIWKRTWDAASKTYQDEFRWCTDDIFEVEGTRSVVSDATLAKLAAVTLTSTANHEQGEYTTNTVIDLWGVRNLPDPVETELPKKDNYQTPPQSDWMWDEDDDGNPGVTVKLTGSISADAYLVSRSVYRLEGTVLSTDHIQGLARSQKTNQHTVKATNSLAEGESKTRPDTSNPKASWFDMVRLGDNATCDDVRAALADGRLATRQPF